MNLDDKMLRELQMVELEMLKEVDRICRENDINYSLDSGTLLGAVRHKGFIPWDDDADIVMLREEYERFYKACQTQLDTNRFFLQEYRTDKHYRWGYSKMRRNNTIFERYGQENLKWNKGMFIDIFVYDNVPDGFVIRRLHLFLCFIIRKILYSVIGRDNAKYAPLRMWYEILYKIPRNFLFRIIERIAYICNRQKTRLVRHITFPYRKECKYGLPLECFDEYIELEFENHQFKCFKNYDLYLRTLYDDYMVPPPEEDRVLEPVSNIKFP